MSSVTGIVAEYDPFHRGHVKHLRAARERTGADFVYVALSGCFRQRGDAAMLSPWNRAACALAAGADAVFMLPTVWTLRDAEHYALGAVSLLSRMGAAHLAFGAEEVDIRILEGIADKLEHPDPGFRETLRAALQAGNGYPRAVETALGAENASWGRTLSRPNNILAIAYLRAIRRLGCGMKPVAIPRTGDYHASGIDPDSPSASAIRAALMRGDYGNAFPAVTETCEGVIRRAMLDRSIPDGKILDQMVIRSLRRLSPEEAEIRLTDLSEGLANRIIREARTAQTRRELLDRVCTKRYPQARINRILTRAMLEITPADMEDAPVFSEILLLGMKPNPEMTGAWKQSGIRICHNIRDMAPDPAFSIWGQSAGLWEDWAYRQRTVTG